MAGRLAHTNMAACPFCDIAARAPARFNRAVLRQFQNKRRRASGGEDDAAASSPPPPPPPLLLLPSPPARLVFADRLVVAFVDRTPAAEQHLLVCPRPHVANVNTMLDVAERGGRIALPPPTAGGGHDREDEEEEEEEEEEEDNDDDANNDDAAVRAGQGIDPADLADHMRAVGEALLWQRRGGRRRGAAAAADGGGGGGGAPLPLLLFGYHAPPWRSVDHLHLHCIEAPFRPAALEAKYSLEWLNWLPDDKLRARLRAGGGAAGAAAAAAAALYAGGGAAARRRGSQGRGGCCWPFVLRRGGGADDGLVQGGGGSGREPLVPPPPPPPSSAP
jgi:hypothetical protein